MHLPCRFSRPILAAAIIASALHCAACVPAPKIEDLGGYRVTYALRAVKPGDQQSTVEAVQRRLDAIGASGAKVSKSGTDQIEITLPDIRPDQLEQLRKLVVTPGKLEFRILAQKGTHDALIDAATVATTVPDDQPQDDQPQDDQPQDDQAKDETSLQSKWVRFDPQRLELPVDAIQRTRDGQFETLIVLDANNVDNRSLASVSGMVDSRSEPAIGGRFTPEGGRRMRALTTDNAPTGNVYQSLGIVLDDSLLVAPRIREPFGEAFMLTGNFTRQEVEFLLAVLRAGRLPVELDPQPVKIEEVTAARE